MSRASFTNRVWNYGDLNSIACEQLFDEACTYRIAPDNFKAIQPYLLAGLDASFAKNVQVGDLMLGGEKFRLWEAITTCGCRFKGGRYQSDYREIGGSPFF